jgi:hypothetical protein
VRRLVLVTVVFALLDCPASATAELENVLFEGGTARQRTEVVRALSASSFNWDLLPQVTVHIGPNMGTYATPGHVWLNANLLDAKVFSWAAVQHEFAHQVDFLLLAPAQRVLLLHLLGGKAWCYERAGLIHSAYGCERFASTLTWSYWPSRQNCFRPRGRGDESAAMEPRAFRNLLAALLGPSVERDQKGPT